MSRRFQFSLKELLVVTLVVAAFFGGMISQREIDRPQQVEFYMNGKVHLSTERIQTSDGTYWYRGGRESD
jgi:hypothetical protein